MKDKQDTFPVNVKTVNKYSSAVPEISAATAHRGLCREKAAVFRMGVAGWGLQTAVKQNGFMTKW